MSDPMRRARRSTIAALLFAAVLAASCGKSEPTANGTADARGGSADTTPDILQTSSGPIVDGGKLIVGLEAETDGWDPINSRWAAPGTQVAMSFYDPLVGLDDKLGWHPYLAEKLTPSNDARTWDITLRSGIEFHNGEKLDADALVNSIEALRKSTLTGAAARPITDVKKVDPLTVRLEMAMPWATFPFILTAQAGVVPAPAQLASGADAALQPIGTGPFVFKEWIPDSRLTVSKNPNYWREGLPHFDSVEFRPITDTDQRFNAVMAGDVDMVATTAESTIRKLLDAGSQGRLQVVRSTGQNDVSFVLLNLEDPIMKDHRVREAMAFAINKESFFQTMDVDPSLKADSAFQPELGYHVDTGFPSFDLEKAKGLVADYERENGKIEFDLTCIPDPESQKSAQALSQMFADAGIKANVKTVEYSTFVLNAVTGKYTASVWRQFGAADPDVNYIWWHSGNADPPLALNMARNRDPELDAALLEGRSTTDPEKRKAAYAKVQERQTADLPYLWLRYNRWTLGAQNNIRGLTGNKLPDGATRAGLVSGIVGLADLWRAPS